MVLGLLDEGELRWMEWRLIETVEHNQTEAVVLEQPETSPGQPVTRSFYCTFSGQCSLY